MERSLLSPRNQWEVGNSWGNSRAVPQGTRRARAAACPTEAEAQLLIGQVLRRSLARERAAKMAGFQV